MKARSFMVLWVFMAACLPIAQADLNDGLMAYYPFLGDAADQSGNGNHCTVNGAIIAEGVYGDQDSSYQFDGQDDYLACGNDASINPTDALSVAAWVKTGDVSQSARVVSKWGLDSGYDLDITSEVVRVALNQQLMCTHSIAGLEDSWVHIAFSWDGSTVALFVNGQPVCQTSFAGPLVASSLDLLIGEMANFAPTAYFQGLIDEVRIYNRFLTTDELRVLSQIPIFGDGFESGDTSAWSATVP